MTTAMVFVHGRNQQMARPLRGDTARVGAHVAGLRREWLAGLAKGLVLAGAPPLVPSRAYLSFYGNAMADAIDRHEAAGGTRPDLELGPGTPITTRDLLVVEAAEQLGFDPVSQYDGVRVPDPLDDAERSADGASADADELGWADALSVPVVTSALRFLANRTGTAGWVIEAALTDVAYYLALAAVRDRVLDIVQTTIADARREHDEVVLVSHSLGTVVAYDALQSADTARPVPLLVTLGSPLGLPVVRRHLIRKSGQAEPGVPDIDANGPRWINAYDVRDVVALAHPLASAFTGGAGAILDVVTHNPSEPHAVDEYLADPDVAGPIADAMG